MDKIDYKDLRRTIKVGYFFGCGALYLIFTVVINLSWFFSGQGLGLVFGSTSDWVQLVIALVGIPLILYIQGILFGYIVTFGLRVSRPFRTH